METPNGKQTFSYDHWNGTKNDNRIYAINGSSASTGHDANGNLTKLVLNGVTAYYVYDSANRLIQVKDSAGNVTVSYTYNGDGQRLNKTANGGYLLPLLRRTHTKKEPSRDIYLVPFSHS